MALEEVELEINQARRTPCMLLLDTSGSMDGPAINALNAGLRILHQELTQDDTARVSVEIAIVSFGGGVELVQDFVTVDSFVPPTLLASGMTPLGQATLLALNKLRERKQTYKDHGISYTRPWLMLMTDGAPTDDCTTATQQLVSEQRRGGVEFFPIIVGDETDDVLSHVKPMCVGKPVMHLDGLQFTPLFKWLSASSAKLSASRSGEQVALPAAGWGSVLA